jgi:hypothetical protein
LQPYEDSFHGASISSVYNNWPEKVENSSIFPYLLAQQPQHLWDFSKFVQEWYKTSCAIVCRNSDTDYKIIGTGSLIGKHNQFNVNVISTARHNYQGLSNLYVRFFNYKVQPTDRPNQLMVEENYLDIPVVGREDEPCGLDAGHLLIPRLQNNTLFATYARLLQIDASDAALPGGNYAMFHFAGGRPQISVGEISSIR